MQKGNAIIKMLAVLAVLVFGAAFTQNYYSGKRQTEFEAQQAALKVKNEADERAEFVAKQNQAMQDAINKLNQAREGLAAQQIAPRTDDKTVQEVSTTQPVLPQSNKPVISDADNANQQLAAQVAAMEKEQADRDAIAKANRLKFKTIFDKLMALNVKWESNEALAGNIGRVGLAAPIQRMQDVKAELASVETFGCLTDLKAAIGMNMDSTITAFTNFAGGSRYNGATVTYNAERKKVLDRVLLTCN